MTSNERGSKIDRCGHGTPYGCGAVILHDAHMIEHAVEVSQFDTFDNRHRLFHAECCPCRIPGLTRPEFMERLLAEIRRRAAA